MAIQYNSSAAVVSNLSDAICEQLKKGLKFDQHIEASITAIIDSSHGIYRVKYQDATFNVKSENNVKYQKGDRVLVLIPQSDFNSPNKMITGTVSRDLTNYGGQSNLDELSYEKIGTNLYRPTDSSHVFKLCSYKIYEEKDYINNGVLAIPLADLTEQFTYITDATHLQLKFKLKTSSPDEQKKAAFGIELKLNFKSRNEDATEYTRTYRLEPHSLVGSNVYKLPYYMEQNYIFDITDDAENFVKIDKAYVYVSNYFNKDTSITKDDIFIKDLEILALSAMPKSEEEYRLILSTPKGQYFSGKDPNKKESLPLNAKIYLNGQEASTVMKTAKFYWFKEDLSITEKSSRYLNYGGNGWLCMNKGGPKDDKSHQYVWEAGTSSQTLSESSILSKKRSIKCVAVINSSIILSATTTIYKQHGIWDLSITSTDNAITLTDKTKTTLTCSVQYPQGEENKDELPDGNDFFTFTWQKPDNYNQLHALSSTEDEKKNTLEVKGSSITASQVYKCGVMLHRISKNSDGKDIDDAFYVGTAEIKLFNYDNAPEYSLSIVNGNQLFKYNEEGISPVHRASGYISQKINPLSFEIYDRKGQKVSDELINKNVSSIIFKIPKIDFGIQEKYSLNYSNNQIFLSLSFKPSDKKDPITLSAYTNLIFTKTGALGTNSIGNMCWIQDNESKDPNKKYLEIDNTSADKDGKVSLLYESGKFKVSEMYYPKTEDTIITVDNNKWVSLARASECSNLYIETDISKEQEITSAYFDFKKDIIKNKNQVWYDDKSLYPFANFIQLGMKINGQFCSSVMPIVATKYNYDTNGIKKEDKWSIKLKQNTGFLFVQYESNGTKPLYDSDLPFELEVTKDNASKLNDKKLKIEWKCYGNLEIVKQKDDFPQNKYVVKPKSSYSGYGYANYVYARMWYNTTFLGGILIPIYFYLNQRVRTPTFAFLLIGLEIISQQTQIQGQQLIHKLEVALKIRIHQGSLEWLWEINNLQIKMEKQ